MLVDEREIADFVERQPVRVFGQLVGRQTPGPDVSGADVEIEGVIRSTVAVVVAASPRGNSDD